MLQQHSLATWLMMHSLKEIMRMPQQLRTLGMTLSRMRAGSKRSCCAKDSLSSRRYYMQLHWQRWVAWEWLG